MLYVFYLKDTKKAPTVLIFIEKYHMQSFSIKTQKNVRVENSQSKTRWNEIEQKGTTFDHDFGFYFPLISSPLKKEGRRKGE